MGKTYKKTPRSMHRRPKGFKQAKINQTRNKAVPPNSWEDLGFDDQCYIPYNAAESMFQKGFDKEKIIDKLKRKFNLSHQDAREIAESVVRRFE